VTVDATFAVRAAEVGLEPEPLDPAQVLAGTPATSGAVLWASADGRIVRGVWRCTAGTVTDVEQDELFVVLEGRATIEVEGGPVLEVAPGTVAVLERGARTTWTVHEPLLKAYQITLHD
jgi:uncharacterized cupin superfamily protein